MLKKRELCNNIWSKEKLTPDVRCMYILSVYLWCVLGIGSQWKLWRGLVGSGSVVLDSESSSGVCPHAEHLLSVHALGTESESRQPDCKSVNIHAHKHTPAEIRHWCVCVLILRMRCIHHSCCILDIPNCCLKEEILHRTSSLLRVAVFTNSFAALTFLHDHFLSIVHWFCYCTFKAYIGLKKDCKTTTSTFELHHIVSQAY